MGLTGLNLTRRFKYSPYIRDIVGNKNERWPPADTWPPRSVEKMTTTTRTQTVHVPYKGVRYGHALTLESITYESIVYDWDGVHNVSCYIILSFVRDKDGKRYQKHFHNEPVDLSCLWAVPSNHRGHSDLYRRV